MVATISVLALLLVAVTMGLSLAHALEFPGKLRLDEATYRRVQAIYYPGFTIGGLIGEFGGILVLAVLLFLAPAETKLFCGTAVALCLLLAGHAVYWIVTHPVNKAWLEETELAGPSRFFFGLFSRAEADWKHMRSAWEWSHVARACLAMLALLSMTLAILR
jgi:hypothetical protein